MADKCSSCSESDEFSCEFEENSEQEQSSDVDDSGEVHTRFSSDIYVTTPKKKRRRKIFDGKSESNDTSRSVYYSSDADSGQENSNVLIKTPRKRKRSATVEPVSDDEGRNSVPETPADNEESGPHETIFEEFESDLSDVLSLYESPESAPPDDTSSDESNGNDTDTDGTGDNFQECSSQTPLYPGCNLTSENFDALFLALFKKHHMSEAAKEDLLKVLELTLPAENNVATSSYRFNKRHEDCTLPYEFKELCPTCHSKVEEEVCRNRECDNQGQRVDPVTFYVIPLKPQIQRLLKGKSTFVCHIGKQCKRGVI